MLSLDPKIEGIYVDHVREVSPEAAIDAFEKVANIVEQIAVKES